MTARSENVTFRITGGAPATNTVAAGMAKGLVEFAVARGAERSALLAASGLDADAIAQEDARVPFARYAALYGAAELLCGDPAFALHFGEAVDSMDSMLVCHVGSAQPTMGAAFEAINRYGRLAVDVETVDGGDPFQVEPSEAGHWLIDASIYPGTVRQLTETSFARLIAGTRQLTDRNFVSAVHFTWPAPAHLQEYERVFRAPVRFAQRRNAMLIDPEWFALPLHQTSPYAGAVFETHANRLLEELPVARCRRAVEDILRRGLDAGTITIEHVADQLGVSRQTLYRQLRAEGATFEDTLDRVRRELAMQWLRQGTTIADIAHRLGFSERSAFSRAFKRWTGRSPRSAAKA
ncbi:MAG TPA: AraC family transcriptional regulator ligand-binding domain-containing protein [Vicinamibacterales bacterium]|nr:AraC family transcriptional regulator ligand-binding domain-containing protein [Vicinamibacterales bacterium]